MVETLFHCRGRQRTQQHHAALPGDKRRGIETVAQPRFIHTAEQTHCTGRALAHERGKMGRGERHWCFVTHRGTLNRRGAPHGWPLICP